MRSTLRAMVLILSAAAFCLTASAQEAKPQSKCPFMGGKISKTNYVDVKGYRIYVCCPGCLAKVKADPDAAIAKIKANGETPEAAPVVLCKACGQIKGSGLCCKPGQQKCAGCGLTKGSPGCCKIPTDTTEDIVLCPKCGEIKGTDECCKAEGRTKCGKCGMLRGAPGCCKMPAPEQEADK